jgi:hypothetical protein
MVSVCRKMQVELEYGSGNKFKPAKQVMEFTGSPAARCRDI